MNCKSKRPHTPYTSGKQTIAGNIALGVREGKIPGSKLRGASKEMAKGMTLKELRSHSKEAKGKSLPYSILKTKNVELSKYSKQPERRKSWQSKKD
jgi:hypothetical protein